MRLKITIIAAITPEGVMGTKDGQLPWLKKGERLKGDLPDFKERTAGNYLVMGRLTYDSLPNKPLADRYTFVLATDPAWKAANPNIPGQMEVQPTLQDVIELIEKRSLEQFEKNGKHLFISGGSKVFEEALPLADEIILTVTKKEYPGRVFFPKIEKKDWDIETLLETDQYTRYRYTRK